MWLLLFKTSLLSLVISVIFSFKDDVVYYSHPFEFELWYVPSKDSADRGKNLNRTTLSLIIICFCLSRTSTNAKNIFSSRFTRWMGSSSSRRVYIYRRSKFSWLVMKQIFILFVNKLFSVLLRILR